MQDHPAWSTCGPLKQQCVPRVRLPRPPHSPGCLSKCEGDFPKVQALVGRRLALTTIGTLLAGGLLGSRVAPASAKLDPRPPSPDDLDVYFGAGCFWHVQVNLDCSVGRFDHRKLAFLTDSISKLVGDVPARVRGGRAKDSGA